MGRFLGLPERYCAGYTSRRTGPDPTASAELPRILARDLGAGRAEVSRLRQVHGRQIVEATGEAVPGADRVLGEADALITRDAGRLLAIFTADCVPIVLVDPESGWISAIHAGWRGTALRIVDAVLDRLEARGAGVASLFALFGPSISGPRYEVGPEVAGPLRACFPDGRLPAGGIVPGRDDRSHVDLALLNETLLLHRGVRPERILRTGFCTASEPSLFPSYRRDGPGTGRIVTGVIRKDA